ncbi:MAG: phosphotransferase [Bacteroidetes bacterium]|nr:phosphotransferase [Bacteroidota bacterium]
MENYPIVPGRGLVTNDAKEMRVRYLREMGFLVDSLSATGLEPMMIRNNIESFIGSVEIPVGLVGPLLFNGDEMVYAPAVTLEGALVASMNRGAKAVSKSGGFRAVVVHQKMTRSPMFIFDSLSESVAFQQWVSLHFDQIRFVAEQYSNHAKLQAIVPVITGKAVHLKFVYTTGDASGQNMTTTCTWHAILWINRQFMEESGIEPVHFVIEGNGASDKKVSYSSLSHGRGVHVIAECELQEAVIEKVLRTSSADFIRCINQSRVLNQLDGMVGYNINVANAIAAIFAATGQDLASIHESSVGVLNIEQSPNGLYCSLSLPSLVIGTVGGGTHLAKQQEALGLMGCAGAGKIGRFAQLIAGFALSLEVSTFAAIVGGQFAKAHEKLGRNKPVNWLTKSELNKDFVKGCMNGFLNERELLSVRIAEGTLVENGIMTSLAGRVNKKLVGFVPMDIGLREISLGASGVSDVSAALAEQLPVLVKSKPLDTEVIKGLHLMAASIDPELADLIVEHRDVLEYSGCHEKEILLYDRLRKGGLSCTPFYYGARRDEARELYVLLLERLDERELLLFNSENEPGRWSADFIESAIRAIHGAQVSVSGCSSEVIGAFEPWKAAALYEKLARIIGKDYEEYEWVGLVDRLAGFIAGLEAEHDRIGVGARGGVGIGKTIVHNDFNPRNACVRKDGSICIYDWELAVWNFPHRDVVELLSFVLPLDFEARELERYLRYHYSLQGGVVEWKEWKAAYAYSLKEYLVTRVSFYMAGRILMDYEFAERIFLNAFRMIDCLEML